MPRVEFVTHKDQRILILDLSETQNVGESVAAVQAALDVIVKEPPKSVRLLTDITHSHYTAEGVDVLKRFSKTVTPYMKASASVGVLGIRRIIVRSLMALSGRRIEMFDSRQDALDWLARQ